MLSSVIKAAHAAADEFLSARLTAIEFEAALLSRGFHSVEFDPPSAVYLGVRYELSGLARHFNPSDWQRLKETF